MPFGMDMNFTGAMIVLSDAIPREHQGMIFSLVNMILNYSVSIGLGVAGTVAVYNMPNQTDLRFYRYGWYTGLGFSGMGLLVTLVWICVVKSKSRLPSPATRTISVKKEVNDFNLEEGIDNNYQLDALRLSIN